MSATARKIRVAGLQESPLLHTVFIGDTAEMLTLKDGITIEVCSSRFRTLRGPTYICAVVDELAFLMADELGSSNPDTEIIKSIRPGLSTTGGPLVMISSPYARRGVLWDSYRRNFGKNGDPLCLVVQADSRTMNPSLSQRVIDREFEKDAASAAAEYGALFRTDIESFVSREAVDACVVPGRHELSPTPGTSYAAFVDPSGGSSDAMALAVGHKDGDRAIVDAVRERRPPFSPDDVVLEFCGLLKSYGVRQVTGDRYGGGWPAERFRIHGIEYIPAEKPKSDLYRDMLPLLNSGRIELLDLPRLAGQLCGLERRTARSGRDSIDHGPNSHDDVANAVAGVCAIVAEARPVDWSCAGQIISRLQPYRGYGRRGMATPSFDSLPRPTLAALGSRLWGSDPT